MKNLLKTSAIVLAAVFATSALAAPAKMHYVSGSLRSTNPRVTCNDYACVNSKGEVTSSMDSTTTISIDWKTLTFIGGEGPVTKLFKIGHGRYLVGGKSGMAMYKIADNKVEFIDGAPAAGFFDTHDFAG